jgi:hypothetical protein
LSKVRFRRHDGVGCEPCPPRLTRMTRTFQNGREPSTKYASSALTTLQCTKFLHRDRDRSQSLLYCYSLLLMQPCKRMSFVSIPAFLSILLLIPASLAFHNIDRAREGHFLSPSASCHLYASHRGKGVLHLAFSLYTIFSP